MSALTRKWAPKLTHVAGRTPTGSPIAGKQLDFLKELTAFHLELNGSKKPLNVYKRYANSLKDKLTYDQRKELLRLIAHRQGITVSVERIKLMSDNDLIALILKKQKKKAPKGQNGTRQLL